MKNSEIKKALKSENSIFFKVRNFAGVLSNNEKYVVISNDEETDKSQLIGCCTLSGVNCFVRAETKKGYETEVFEIGEFLKIMADFVEEIDM